MTWLESSRAVNDLCKRLPENTLITASEHGFISANNPSIGILDLTGLHDPIISRFGFSESYLKSRSPQIIWLAYKDQTALNHSIITSSYFQKHYIFLPGVFAYGVAVRNDNPLIKKILSEELKVYYPEYNFNL